MLSGCRQATPPADDALSTSTPGVEVGTASPVDEAAPVVAEGYQVVPINPPRMASLTAQQAEAQINLRSQPTTQSTSLGYGLAGDQVELRQLAEGEGGFSWYYAYFPKSKATGWIRGDFIDTATPTAAKPATNAASPTPAASTSTACGADRQESFFETPTFIITICKTAQGLRYIGLDKSNQNSLITDDVQYSQGTYIAINGTYQYHVNDQSLAVYQVEAGKYTQLVAEPVTRHERYVY